jgi:micrococcal nuclease
MYEYQATVVKVYDGDTITADIDVGFGITIRKQKLRLLGVAAPEVRGIEKEEGKKSRDALRKLILGKQIIIKTKKDKKGKYGRWLATIFLGEQNINQWLIMEGHATVY